MASLFSRHGHALPRLLSWLPMVTAALLLLALAWTADRAVADEIARRSHARITQTSRLYAEQISRLLAQRSAELSLLGHDADLAAERDRATQHGALERWREHGCSDCAWLAVVANDGAVLAATEAAPRDSFAGRPSFEQGRQGAYVGAPVERGAPLDRLAELAVPVGEAGTAAPRAVLVAQITVAVADALRDEVLGAPADRAGLDLHVVDADARARLGAAPATGRSDEPVITSVTPVRGVAPGSLPVWHVIASQPFESALGTSQTLRTRVAGIGLLALVVLGGAAMWLGQRMMQPLSQVLDTVAARLGPARRAETSDYLRTLNEQMLAQGESDARARAELEALTQRLMAQERQTTQRLAQVLHDGLGQTLMAARLTTDALIGSMHDEWPAAEAARAVRLAALVEKAGDEVRSALVDLRPPFLEDNGLVVALDSEVRRRAEGAEPVRLVFEVSRSARAQRWPAEVEYAAFMVAREAIVNALLHARADAIVVWLDGDVLQLELEVRDDGIGFDPAGAPRPGHLGLIGMRERAAAVGATVRIDAPAAALTVVRFAWEPAG